MNAHTPGPWYANRNSAGSWGVMTIRDADVLSGDPREFVGWPYGANICMSIGDQTESRTCGNEEANARLIAAAPELLEACMAARALTPDGTHTAGVLDAAIAKAKGEQS